MRRRVELDIEYLKNWSLGLDVRILLKTLRIMWSDQSAY
jgi:putative colanic acid biosynthesis UDP-glucose lipid carrier transferase